MQNLPRECVWEQQCLYLFVRKGDKDKKKKNREMKCKTEYFSVKYKTLV